jgi:hypothetical protein
MLTPAPCLTARGVTAVGVKVFTSDLLKGQDTHGSSRDPRGLLCAARREDPTLKLERTGRREAAEPVPVTFDRYNRLVVKCTLSL